MKNLNFTQEELKTLFNISNQLISNLSFDEAHSVYVLQLEKLIDLEDVSLKVLGSLQSKLFKELKSLCPELF
jgi:transcriptional regulator with XRE-family HTH domain